MAEIRKRQRLVTPVLRCGAARLVSCEIVSFLSGRSAYEIGCSESIKHVATKMHKMRKKKF